MSCASGKRLSGGMSAAAAIKNTLWLTNDETIAIEQAHCRTD